MQADAPLADKAFDADKRVIKPMLVAGKKLVIPPKTSPSGVGRLVGLG
jgi:hypothetical protein